MINIRFRGRRYARAGGATALAAIASLGFAAPAAATGLQVNPSTGPTGKTNAVHLAQARPEDRQVTVTWTADGVNWGPDSGVGPGHQWVVTVTPPTGPTLPNGSCGGTIMDSPNGNNCEFTGSADGTYTVTVAAKTPYGTSPDSATATINVKQTVFIPSEPRDLKVLPGPNELVLSWQPPADPGSGVASYYAEVTLPGNDGDTAGSCTTTELTCTVKGLKADSEYGAYVVARTTGTDRTSYPVTSGGLVKTLPAASSAPTPPASVPTSAGKLTAPSTSVTANQSVTLSGSGYAAHTPVQIVVYSTPQVLKTVTTDGTGAFSTSVTLPAGLTGSHTLVAGGVGPDGVYRYLTLPVTAAAAAGLPVTGAAVPKLVAAALVVLAVGFVLVRVTRRRSVFRA